MTIDRSKPIVPHPYHDRMLTRCLPCPSIWMLCVAFALSPRADAHASSLTAAYADSVWQWRGNYSFDFPEPTQYDPSVLDETFHTAVNGIEGRAVVNVGLRTGEIPSIKVLAESDMESLGGSNPPLLRVITTARGEVIGDRIHLTAVPSLPDFPIHFLRVGVAVDGVFTSAQPQLAGLSGSLTAHLNVAGFFKAGIATYSQGVTTFSGFAKGQQPYPESGSAFDDALVFVDVPVESGIDTTHSFSLFYSLVARSVTTDIGEFPRQFGDRKMTVAALNTLTLSKVAFVLADGTEVTPESVGVHVTFDSGAMSPNAVIPEPATAVLAAIGAVCACVVASRRHRRASRVGHISVL